MEKFPDKFSEGVLVKYIGAEVYGKKKNDLGKLLENYVKSVIEKKKVKNVRPVLIQLCHGLVLGVSNASSRSR